MVKMHRVPPDAVRGWVHEGQPAVPTAETLVSNPVAVTICSLQEPRNFLCSQFALDTHMAHSIVLRLKGLFPNQLGKFSMYAQRFGGDLSHIDETKSGLNEIVIGPPNWVKQLRAKIADASVANLGQEIAALRARQRPGDAKAVQARGPVDPWQFTRIGPLREGILTVHKAWFGGSGADRWDPKKVAAFRARGIAFLTESFGETCVHARIEHDEEALHFHFVLAPWHEKRSASRGRQRLLQPSSHPMLKSYELAQDIVADYFADLGLIRGERHAEARRAAKAKGEAVPPRPVHVNTWNFLFSITNLASAGAVITSWGFDTTPVREAGSFIVSGPNGIWRAVEGNSGGMTIDNCAFVVNCDGGRSKDGIQANVPANFTFSFDLAEGTEDVTFDKFLTRWQSVGQDGEGSVRLDVIPLPASSLLLLSMMGAGGIAAWRKRRQAA